MDVSLLIRLVDQFTGPAQKVRGALENIGSGINRFKSGASDALKSGFSIDNIEAATKNAEIKLSQARGKLLGAFGQALAIGAPVIKAAQFDQSMKGLEKVLNDLPVERIQQLRKFALDTSALIPIAAKDLLELMSEAAQGDVPQEELEAFSTYVAKASVAFDMAGKEIGERFAKAAAGWYDRRRNKTIYEEHATGLEGPTRRLRTVYASQAEAKKAAEAEGARLARATGQGSLTMAGTPEVMADAPINALGFRKEFDGEWRAASVEHRFEDTYTTSIELEAPEKGKE
ncbi:phage tail tape measure protein [Brucella inopinata]|uniref:Phage tail tape measure protein n=1 Tax=Brucella inopinata TaxID=1218315 RepID=A0AAW7B4V2_9HYPH|nr:phage tail tape measure protein [Brucella inopinata]MDL2332457.1 phage tail tape measure protein [Brucella inopinata]